MFFLHVYPTKTSNFRLKLKTFNVLYILSLFFIISCSSSDVDLSLYKDKSLRAYLSSPWEPIKSEQSDYAFINTYSKSIIVINSTCKKHQKSSLKQLTFNILGGLNNLSIENSIQQKYMNKNILVTNAKGSLEGIDVYVTIKSFRMNKCLYDYLLISKSKNLRVKDQHHLNSIMKK